MSEKVLTIAICAYNMEKYLENAIESCLINNLDKIEILVMDDGSTDRTKEIAKSYEQKYPDCVIHVAKENGGWGSNLNAAIPIARGKYFRELDADDCYDKANLEESVEILEKLDVDIAFNEYRYCFEKTGKSLDHISKWYGLDGKTADVNSIPPFFFNIWNAAWNTELLRKYHKALPHKTLYTDNLFVLNLLPYIKKGYFDKKVIYNYRIGRDDQSVSASSVKKHYQEIINVFKEALTHYDDQCDNSAFVKFKVLSIYYVFVDMLISACDGKNKEMKSVLIDFENYVKDNYPAVYEEAGKSKKMKLLRKSNYMLAGFFRLYYIMRGKKQ